MGRTALPLAVQRGCTELQHHENQESVGSDWDKPQVRHHACTTHGTILVRGYGIGGQYGAQTGQFLILLETLPTELSVQNLHGAAECQFTERQRGIVNGLVLGLTNKDIAESMRNSVHTVKEYIRQLMRKLHTTSRTGIAARVAGLTVFSTQVCVASFCHGNTLALQGLQCCTWS
jgi:DNA-binding CsgD family transcriptional regulator